MRVLASIQKIIKLESIEGADKIEKATILGWNVIVEKGLYKKNDLVIYCEVDSLLPLRPEFEFLAKNNSPKKMLIDGKEVQGYRIKTIRLRGQISQGICFPISLISNRLDLIGSIPPIEGMDLTALMGIYKYEIPLPVELSGKVRSYFPGFFPKTDEVRIQAFPQILERYSSTGDHVDLKFYVTEKVDGTSVSLFIKDDEFHACSRNLDLLDDGKNTIWQVAKELKIEEKLKSHGLTQYVLQGELVGEGIQKNTLKIKGHKILFFNIYNYVAKRYLDYQEFVERMDELELETVPVIGDNYILWDSVDTMVKFATTKSKINPSVWAEGVVWRPLHEMKDKDIGRLSFKIVNPMYLLQYD